MTRSFEVSATVDQNDQGLLLTIVENIVRSRRHTAAHDCLAVCACWRRSIEVELTKGFGAGGETADEIRVA